MKTKTFFQEKISFRTFLRFVLLKNFILISNSKANLLKFIIKNLMKSQFCAILLLSSKCEKMSFERMIFVPYYKNVYYTRL